MTTEQKQFVDFLLEELSEHLAEGGAGYLLTLRFVLSEAHGAAAHAPKQRRRRKAGPDTNVIGEVRSS